MRQLLLLTTLFLATHFASAQLTITQAENNPTVGDTFTQHVNSNVDASFDFGPAGENVTWDLSSYGSASTAPVNVVQADDPEFPDATIAYTQNGTETFFKTDNDAFSYYGINGTAEVIYTDPEDQARFPMTYGDSYIDSKEGTFDAFTQAGVRTGTMEVTADGYGTLITPLHEYNNALRLQLIRRDTDVIGGNETTSQDTLYFWYAEGIHFPVATFFRVYSGGSFVQASFNYIEQESNTPPLGQGLSEANGDLEIYPNPVKDQLHVQQETKAKVHCRILTSSGQLIDNREVRDGLCNVSDLSPGVYILQIQNEERAVSRRFVKQ